MHVNGIFQLKLGYVIYFKMHLSQLNLTHGAKNKWEFVDKWEFVAQKERCLSRVCDVSPERRETVCAWKDLRKDRF